MSAAGVALLCKAGKPRIKTNRLPAEDANDTVTVSLVIHIERLVPKAASIYIHGGQYNHGKTVERLNEKVDLIVAHWQEGGGPSGKKPQQ